MISLGQSGATSGGNSPLYPPGSEFRFPSNKWINFSGVMFRKGQVTLYSDKIVFAEGTEFNYGDSIYRYDGTVWTRVSP